VQEMVYLKVVQKIIPLDVSVSETIDQKTYLKKFRGASAPLAPTWIRLCQHIINNDLWWYCICLCCITVISWFESQKCM